MSRSQALFILSATRKSEWLARSFSNNKRKKTKTKQKIHHLEILCTTNPELSVSKILYTDNETNKTLDTSSTDQHNKLPDSSDILSYLVFFIGFIKHGTWFHRSYFEYLLHHGWIVKSTIHITYSKLLKC